MLPIQAMVMILGFHPLDPPQLTITAGTGESTFPGFQLFFIMDDAVEFNFVFGEFFFT